MMVIAFVKVLFFQIRNVPIRLAHWQQLQNMNQSWNFVDVMYYSLGSIDYSDLWCGLMFKKKKQKPVLSDAIAHLCQSSQGFTSNLY